MCEVLCIKATNRSLVKKKSTRIRKNTCMAKQKSVKSIEHVSLKLTSSEVQPGSWMEAVQCNIDNFVIDSVVRGTTSTFQTVNVENNEWI